MKYIRTKRYDLIMKVSEKITNDYGTYYLYEDTKWFEDEILKVADTIEELCDEFVGITEKGSHLRLSGISLKSYRDNVTKEIYGAIWTDKGLIYVAKMNDEGELELL